MRTDVKVGLVCVLALVVAVIAYFTLQSKPSTVPVANGNSPAARATSADSGGPSSASVTPASASPAPNPESNAPPVAFTHQPGLAQTPSVYSPPSGTTTAPAPAATLYPPGGAPRDTLLPPVNSAGSPSTAAGSTPERTNPETPSLGGGHSTEVEPGARPHDSLIEPGAPAYPSLSHTAGGDTPTHDLVPGDAGAVGGNSYVVVSGDNLTVIAKKNHTTISALKAANPGMNPDRLKVKQVIHLPGATAAEVTPTTRPAHTSAAGAATRPSALPGPRHHPATADGHPAGADYTLYTVKSGDTLRKIAKAAYGDEKLWRQISRANRAKLPDPNDIEVGMVLRIPAK